MRNDHVDSWKIDDILCIFFFFTTLVSTHIDIENSWISKILLLIIMNMS